MLRRKKLTFGVLIGGSLFTALLLHFHSSSHKLLQAGDTFPEAEVSDIEGNKVSWPSRSFFVIYMKYDAEMGLQLRNFEHLQLQEQIPKVWIVAGTDRQLRDTFHADGNDLSTIVRDDGRWHSRLGVAEAPFRLFLVDGTSSIRFATDYATPDDFRQLAEKTASGHIEYPVSSPRLLQKGDRFTGFRVLDMRSNAESVFNVIAPTSVICFTSHCAACDLEEEIKTYALSEAQNNQHTSTKLLFSNRFSRADLLRTIDRYGIKSQLLQASENIPGLEDPLSFETYAASEIAQIDLAAGGVVERISYWNGSDRKVDGQ